MLFNSFEFFLFAALFFGLWPLLRRRNNLRWGYLVAASFFFYGWWDWRFLFLIVASGMLDFFAGLGMSRFQRSKKLLLILSIIGNVGSLATFKYLDFCIDNFNGLLSNLGLDWHLNPVGLLLPIGISFYTFQSMSYTIDIYRGKLQPTRNVLHFFAYLAMFPQLVAGPIVRACDLLPQLKQVHPTTEQQRWEGLRLIVLGYFKKAVIADNLAPIVNNAFGANMLDGSSCYWWVIMAMFAFQIYCDFSGYSDIARGLGRWMGYQFPLNFNHPYGAASFRDFWGRWHISLSTWFRDYVYFPLGGSRHGTTRSHSNMWVTMLVSGLWHGAAWTFVIWAAVHSLYLSFERITNWPSRLARLPGGRYLAAIIVFLLGLIAWVFFRAESFAQAISILSILFGLDNAPSQNIVDMLGYKSILVLAAMILWEIHTHFGRRIAWPTESWSYRFLQPATVAIVIAASIYLRGPGSAFVYFQF